MRGMVALVMSLLLVPGLCGAVTVVMDVPDRVYESLRTAVVGTVEAPADAAAVQAYVQQQAGILLTGLADQGLRQQASTVVEAYLTGNADRRRAIQDATRSGGTRALQANGGSGASTTLASFAFVPLLGWLLGSAWDVGAWVVSSMFVWALCYWLWEARPCRRLLFGVTRRLYGRSLED